MSKKSVSISNLQCCLSYTQKINLRDIHVFETRNRQNLTGAGRRTKKKTIYKAHIKRVRATAFFFFWYSITVHFSPKNPFSFQFIGHRKPVIIKQQFILIRKDFWFNKLINNLSRVFGIKDPTLMPTTKTTEGTERGEWLEVG